MSQNMKSLCVYLPEDVKIRIDEAAAAAGLTRSLFIREAIETLLKIDSMPARSQRADKTLRFLEIGVDAILKYHPVENLREIVHTTHKRRLHGRQARGEER